MNGGENGSEKRKTLRFHPKIVYKLDINNHETVSNQKDMTIVYFFNLKLVWDSYRNKTLLF